jgi:hypothetical protein
MLGHRSSLAACIGVVSALGLAAGCSSSSSTAGNDAQDGGAGGAFAPAFKPDVGQIVPNGGPVIASPKIVTVTWNGDPNQAALEDFGDKLGASAYWKDSVSEYGVGPATSGAANHVRVATPLPAAEDASALDAFVIQQLSDTAASGWPAYDASTIYVLYVPSSTTLNPHGAFHSEVAVGANAHVPYAVVDENGDGNGNGGKPSIDVATANAAHEIAEVATNPHVFSDLGVVGFDAKHVAWQMFISDAELGDICEPNADATFKGDAELPFLLQRMWSNKAAVAGHNPCVPSPQEPYYNVTPLDLETVSVFVDTAAAAQEGWGYRIPIGTQKTIKLGFYSDQPIGAPWSITAVEGNWFSPASNKRLTVAVGKGSGNNGDTDTLTVTANAQSSGAGNAVLLTVVSQAPGLPSHAVPILIGTY